MEGAENTRRQRAQSHKDYLESLHQPSPAECERIALIQAQREREIAVKYHTAEEHDAASVIQKAYRGHRDRRQLAGQTLDPTSRWVELERELRYRRATAPHRNFASTDQRNRSRTASDAAKSNWRRVGEIAERAGAGAPAPASVHEGDSHLSVRRTRSETKEQKTLLLDQRYFLEMVDRKHRYGSNLQVYHEEWQRSNTSENFFYWLDRGGGKHLDLPMCSREKLEKERIRYLSKEERTKYLVQIDEDGKLRWAKNDEFITTSVDDFEDSADGIVPKNSTDPDHEDDCEETLVEEWTSQDFFLPEGLSDDEDSLSSTSASHSTGVAADEQCSKRKKSRGRLHVSPATLLNSLLRKSVRPGTWIYVADTVGRLYVGIKASGAFQHASFLSGGRISSAGSIGIQDGKLTYLSPLSGHYRPTTKSFRSFIDSLKSEGVDTSSLKVSKAYVVLLGMEYYSRSKRDLGKVLHPRRRQ